MQINGYSISDFKLRQACLKFTHNMKSLWAYVPLPCKVAIDYNFPMVIKIACPAQYCCMYNLFAYTIMYSEKTSAKIT